VIQGIFRIIRAALLAPLAGVGLVAAAESPELDLVWVVGKRPQPLQEAAATVSVITSEEISDSIAFDFRDALRFEPGVSFTRDPHRFGTGGPTVRGLGGNRVLIETDGVPAARTFAVGSFSSTGRQFADLAIVDRIEVLRGPASALHGSDAIAGVIATTTIDPSDLLGTDGENAIEARAGYASDDSSVFGAFTAASRTGPVESLFAYSHRQGNELEHAGGSPPANPEDHDSDALFARAVYTGTGQPLRLTAEWNTEQVRIDVDSLELSGGRFANTVLMQGDDSVDSLRILLDQEFDDPTRSGAGVWRAYWQETEIHQVTYEERRAAPPSSPRLAIDREFNYRERVAGAEIVYSRGLEAGGGPHQLTSGLEFAETRVVERRDGLQTNLDTGAATSTILGESLPVRDFPISEIREAGLYVQDEWRPADGRWSLIPALRADWYRLRPVVDDLYAADNPSTPPVRIEENSVSPKLGVNWEFRDDAAFYLQYSHGFRSPPFDDVNIGLDLPQFNVRAIPNPDLEPERSDSIEIGLRFHGAGTTGTLSVYGSRYHDFIESRVNIGVDPGTGTTLFQSQNIGSAEIYGAEAALDFSLAVWRPEFENWTGRFAFTWTEGEDTVRNQPLNSIDPPRALLGLGYETPSGKLGIGFDLTLVAAKDDVDESAGALFKPGGYAVADLRLNWRPGERIGVDVGLFNLADDVHHEWAVVRGRSPADPLLPFYREPGRHFAVTVRAAFD
jgi:hemoglobin/transferrin/lactoferrin receptor protein